MSPRLLFRGVAIAEACTWTGLLVGMWFKYVPEGGLQGELGVQLFGPLHGIAFVAYCLTTVVVAVDRGWSTGRTLVGLLCAVPPFATLAFEWYVEKRDGLAGHWRLATEPPSRRLERPVGWLIRRPAQGLAAGVAAVAVLTAAALVVGPPVG